MKIKKIILLMGLVVSNQIVTAQWSKKNIAIGAGTLAAIGLAIGAKKAWDYLRSPATVEKAAENGNTWILRTSIFLKAPLNTGGDYHGDKPIHRACGFRRTATLKMLLDHGCDVNATNKDNQTPLYSAVRDANLECAQLLLQHQANTEIAAKSFYSLGITPLEIAINRIEVSLPMVQLLIEHKAVIKSQFLVRAIAKEDRPLFNLLLNSIQDHNVLNQALHLICKMHSTVNATEYVSALIARGANVNSNGSKQDKDERLPLDKAVSTHNLPLVRLLLAHGARANAPIILQACYYYNTELLKTLLEAGFNIDGRRDDDGVTALHFLTQGIDRQNLRFKMIRLLIFLGADHTIKQRCPDFGNPNALQLLELWDHFYKRLSDDHPVKQEWLLCLECLRNPLNISHYLTDDEKKEFSEILARRIKTLKRSYDHNSGVINNALAWPGYTDTQSNGPLQLTAEYLGAELIK